MFAPALTIAIEIRVQQVVTLLSRQLVMRDNRCKVEEWIVVASVFPVQESNLGSVDDIRDDEVVVTTAEVVWHGPRLYLAQTITDQFRIRIF